MKLSQSNIPSSILTKLRGYYSEKLRLLSKLPLLAEIPRNVLQEAIEKFKFMKIYFNDLLYSPTLRSESIFVLVVNLFIFREERLLLSLRKEASPLL